MKCWGWFAIMVVLLVGILLAGCGSSGGPPSAGNEPWQQPGTVLGQEIIGPDGGQMVWVPAGTFPMGSEEWTSSSPVREVTMSGFWIGKHEVTNAQYRAFCNATGRQFPADSNQGDNHPVVHVSWQDAAAYAQHYGMSLPTEAQWEYAAAGPNGHLYPWGDEWDGSRLCWSERKGPGGRTFPVGSFPNGASWCGALDMAGNVYEYCADWHQRDYYSYAPNTDPPGPGTGTSKAIRGGSWLWDIPGPFRCANRVYSRAPTYRLDNSGGFRCASTP